VEIEDRGGQGPIWAVAPLDGWMDGHKDKRRNAQWSIACKLFINFHKNLLSSEVAILVK
jgi:hypothetical protein